MACVKCGYQDRKEVKLFGESLCSICSTFAPKNEFKFRDYISEKVDWKILETFRRNGHLPGHKKKEGMHKRAKEGELVTRAPMGYDVVNGRLVPNEESSKVHSLFKVYLNNNHSLNQLSKGYGLSINGLKKVLKNRTYLGEIKFDGQLHKADHKPLVSTEVFYAVQRKLEGHLRPRKRDTVNRYKDLRGESAPLDKEIADIKREVSSGEKKGMYKSIFEN